ncbi:hypothetical protein AYI69_g9675 [Smittium culicis]|uniref:Uncharacterized protein n=1 Tax=Smittium culicis TaxID=133412 RepID=A0A1R1XB68_9FUNG|nr:hypothetical protein AYI69_g9675 [Smittium culicis]
MERFRSSHGVVISMAFFESTYYILTKGYAPGIFFSLVNLVSKFFVLFGGHVHHFLCYSRDVFPGEFAQLV